MSWQDLGLTLLREYLSDTDETAYRFTDDRLEQLLAVAMWRTNNDESFRGGEGYAVDVVNVSVTPDPTEAASLDNWFVDLSVANAACLNDRGAALLAADQALRVKDVGSEVDLRDVFKAKQAVIRDGWCKTYQKMREEYRAGQRDGALGAAIMTPIRLYAGRRRVGFGLY